MLVIGGQRGQALVGVMVVMLILFALAGAVAIGASTLLSRRGESGVTTTDFQARSAVNDSVAQLAGATQRCGAPPPPSPVPTPSPTPTATPLSLSLPPGGTTTAAFCVREDNVLRDSLQNLPVNGAGPSGCATFTVGQPGAGLLAVFFDTRTTARGWAFVDDDPLGPLCTWPLLPTPCAKSWNAGAAAVVPVALSCSFSAADTVYLHVNTAVTWPRMVFVARQDPTGSPIGSVYLLASGTGLPSPDYEESVLFVSTDGTSSRLQYEAPLPS